MLLLHGTLSDSLGRRRVVLTALVCYVAGALLAAAAPDFGWLLAARALQACRPAPASWWARPSCATATRARWRAAPCPT